MTSDSRGQFKVTSILAFAAAAFILMNGCGRADTIYVDPAAGVVGTDGRTFLPTDFVDQSVNTASVEIVTAGDHKELRLRLVGGAAPAGAFNDSAAVGSRAILGIGKYDETLLRAFRLQVTATSQTSSNLRVSLLVDLKCDATETVRTLVSDSIAASASPYDAIWSVAGISIKDSSNMTLVPSASETSRVSLQALLTNFPNACLRAAISDAEGLPKNARLGSLLLTLGDQNSTDVQALQISELNINGDDYKTWGLK